MFLICFYLGICVVGGIIGTFLRKRNIKIAWSGKLQIAMLTLLLFTMGLRLGTNDTIVANLGSIGIISFVITIFIMAGSVLAIFITRRLLGFNKEGRKQ